MVENNNNGMEQSAQMNSSKVSPVTDPGNGLPAINPNNVNNEGVASPMSTTLPLAAQEPKKKKSRLGIVVIVLLVVCILGFVSYRFMFSDPTEVIKDVINRSYEDFSTMLKQYEDVVNNGGSVDLLDDSFKMSGNLYFKDSKNKNLEKEKINYSLGLDYKKKRAELKAGISKNSSVLADASVLFKNDMMYLKSDTILKNKYNIGEMKFDEMFDFEDILTNEETLSIDDIDFIVREMKDALVESLDSEKMSSSKETIDIDGQSVKTTKITYTLDEEAVMNLSNSVVDKIIGNEELVDKLADISGEDAEDLKDSLEESKITEEDEVEIKNSEFTLYTTGITHDVAKIFFGNEDGSLEAIVNDKDKVKFIYTEKGHKAEVHIIKKDERYEVKVYENNKEIVLLNIKELTDERLDIDYVINYDSCDLKGSVVLEEKVENDKKTNLELEFIVDGKIEKTPIKLDMVLTSELVFGSEIATDDVSGAIRGNMSEEDQQYMMEKLSKLENLELLNVLFSSFQGDSFIS